MTVSNIMFIFSMTRGYTMFNIKCNLSRWICEDVLCYTASENLVKEKRIPKWEERY